jgi:hypothetical protein
MSTTGQPHPIPLPRLILRLGGLGNRCFGDKNGLEEKDTPLIEAAEKACEEVMAAIETVMRRIHVDLPPEKALVHWPEQPSWWKTHALALFFGKADRWGWSRRCGTPVPVFSAEPPLVTVLTGDAVGGDRMIRDAALARPDRNGGTVAFEHLRIMPEAPEAVPDGLGVGIPAPKCPAIDQKVAAKQGLTRAEAHQQSEIVRKRAYAYRAQSEALRHHSDLLLAIWDPDTEGKAGGTSESVAAALRERIPVIAIRLMGAGKAEIHLLETERQLHSLQGHGAEGPDPNWKLALQEALTWRLAFPDPAPPHEENSQHSKPPGTYHPRVAFAAFCADEPLRTIWTARLWNIYNALAKYLAARQAVKDAEHQKKKNGHKKIPTGLVEAQTNARKAFWATFWKQLQPWPKKDVPMPPVMEQDKNGNPFPTNSFEYCYERARARAASSGMSGVFGDAHRGGIIASYVFATIAVVLAVSGGILHALHAPAWLQAAFAGTELIIIFLMYALSVCSATEDWNAAYTDTRILAEALRVMRFLGPLGVHTPIPRLPYYLRKSDTATNPDRLWSVWYFQALVRMAPLRLGPPDLEKGRTLVEETGNRYQASYHKGNSAKQHALHLMIERVVPILFALIGFCAVVHFLDVSLGWHITPIFVIGLLFCVGGPALIAGLHGFASQLEISRLHLRSSSMVSLLEERSKALETLDLTTDPTGAETVWGLTTEALTTAALLMDETAGWSMLYRDADIHAG